MTLCPPPPLQFSHTSLERHASQFENICTMLTCLGSHQPAKKSVLLKGCFLEGNVVSLHWNNVTTQSEIIELLITIYTPPVVFLVCLFSVNLDIPDSFCLTLSICLKDQIYLHGNRGSDSLSVYMTLDLSAALPVCVSPNFPPLPASWILVSLQMVLEACTCKCNR